MAAYYNENDPFAAQWLRNLMEAGHIAEGIVDDRSIEDVVPEDLQGFTQCHFFAGIGVWSYGARLAGWEDDIPLWTGSCPCQPFSISGKKKGFKDERHLWPVWFRLVDQCRPPVVLGEQVASPDGLKWLDHVLSDMEGADYACGAVDTCSAGHGAPHIRQRLRFAAIRMADTDNARLEGWREPERERAVERPSRPGRVASGLADLHGGGREARSGHISPAGYGNPAAATGSDARSRDPGPTNGFWRDTDWLFCRDGKWRPVESGTFPMAHGTPGRVGRLRAYGNAVDAQATKTFIEAVMSC